MVRVQIAGVSSLDEALECARVGVDALGFTVRLPSGIHDGLTEVKARGIIAVMPPFVATVAITYVDNAQEAIDLCRYLAVNTLQLHGDFPVRELPKLRATMPHLKLIKAIHVGSGTRGEELDEQARHYERRVDAFIVDTFDQQSGRHGATGKTHDWALTGAFVRTTHTPVILACGLTPDNVGEAIAAVRPWAVDVHTGIEDADGSRNYVKICDFVANTRAAAARLLN